MFLDFSSFFSSCFLRYFVSMCKTFSSDVRLTISLLLKECAVNQLFLKFHFFILVISNWSSTFFLPNMQ